MDFGLGWYTECGYRSVAQACKRKYLSYLSYTGGTVWDLTHASMQGKDLETLLVQLYLNLQSPRGVSALSDTVSVQSVATH